MIRCNKDRHNGDKGRVGSRLAKAKEDVAAKLNKMRLILRMDDRPKVDRIIREIGELKAKSRPNNQRNWRTERRGIMAGYPKIWATKLYNDPWFLSLSNNERGVWFQLLCLAKIWGDSGEFSTKMRQLSGNMGIDDSTLARILGKFANDNKIIVEKKDNHVVSIKICKYQYYQSIRDEYELRNGKGATGEKSAKNPPQPYNHKPDQTRPNTNAAQNALPDINNQATAGKQKCKGCGKLVTALDSDKRCLDCMGLNIGKKVGDEQGK